MSDPNKQKIGFIEIINYEKLRFQKKFDASMSSKVDSFSVPINRANRSFLSYYDEFDRLYFHPDALPEVEKGLSLTAWFVIWSDRSLNR